VSTRDWSTTRVIQSLKSSHAARTTSKRTADPTRYENGERAMKSQNLTAIALAACVLITGSAYAQELPDLNAVPRQMPFNYPFGAPISLKDAQALIQAGITEANKRRWPENFAVVDWSGNLVAFARMDGAQLGSIAIAEHKARAASEFRRPTKSFETGVQKYGFNYLLSFDDIIAVGGGIPLVEHGKIVGAIGCSGATTSQDEVLCEAAIGPPYMNSFSTLGN
jgi:glc operon protein GlcG